MHRASWTRLVRKDNLRFRFVTEDAPIKRSSNCVHPPTLKARCSRCSSVSQTAEVRERGGGPQAVEAWSARARVYDREPMKTHLM
jgi:hypothetical protein